MNISDIWVFFGIAKSLGMFMLNREYAIKDFGKSRLFSLQNELYAEFSYDVAKIDVLDDTPNTSTGAGRAVEGPYPLVKLLNNRQ